MFHPRRLLGESLITRTGLLIGAITLLALLSMLASLVIAEATRGNAAAINLAGSLRMQSYRIASRLLVQDGESPTEHGRIVRQAMDDFEQRLRDATLVEALPTVQNDPLRHQYREVVDTWSNTLHPLLTQLLESSTVEATRQIAYLSRVDDFVGQLDVLVKRLEQYTEDRIRLLRLIQGSALFATVVLVFVVMYQLSAYVVQPLKELMTVAERIRQGDFSARVSRLSEDELGMLGRAFNAAAQDLNSSYRELENRVASKTEALRISNRTLELLYHTARRLNTLDDSEDSLRELLAEIEAFTGPGSTTLCLAGTRSKAERFVQTRHHNQVPTFCRFPACESCLEGAEVHCLVGSPRIMAFPIRDREHHFGVLLVQDPPWQTARDWQSELLKTVAEHIAVALRARLQMERQRRLALLEERTVMARELHDSLAQALSYLKIQVAILQQQLARGDGERRAVNTALADLEDGLNNAYRHLRELLTTFRLSMDEAGLVAALSRTVAEFRERSEQTIDLQASLENAHLSPNQEIHVLQIVREALSNATRHASATQIWVQAVLHNDGRVQVIIQDNGVGLPAEPQRRNHYGLSIMQERTRELGGELEITNRPGGGTEIALRFPLQSINEESPTHARA